jgi:hypothetical protein
MHQEFTQFRTQKRASSIQKSELDAYLEDEHVRDDENFEILSWWKTNKDKYPVLSAMAQDFAECLTFAERFVFGTRQTAGFR